MASKRKSFSSAGKRPSTANVQLTSLMDALTIILIFLLTNYSEQPDENDMPDFIKLPITVGSNEMAVKIDFPVIIGEHKVRIGKDREITYGNFESESERVLGEYRDVIKEEKEKLEQARGISSESKDEVKSKIRVSIQADKGIPYKVIDKFLSSTAEGGVNFFNFVVQKKQE